MGLDLGFGQSIGHRSGLSVCDNVLTFFSVWSGISVWSLIEIKEKMQYGRLFQHGRKYFLEKMLPWSLISTWSSIRKTRVLPSLEKSCTQLHHDGL